MEKKMPYKTQAVKNELLERTLDVMFDIMEQRHCNIRDISQVDIYKKGKINRKTFTNNFHGISGIHTAAAENVSRCLTGALGIREGSDIQLNVYYLIRMLTELRSKNREVEFAILSGDQDFWLTSASALKPLLRNTWGCRSEIGCELSVCMFAAVLSFVVTAWSRKNYDRDYQDSAASLLDEYSRRIGKINRDLHFYLSSVSLFN